MAAVNYADEYQRELSQQFPYVLYFGKLYATPANGRYRFLNSKTIEIPTLHVKGRRDANRDNIVTPSRRWENEWTPLKLTNERYWDTLVSPSDIDQTNQAASIANITSVYNQEEKFPEMDAYTVSKIYADWKVKSYVADTTPLSVENVLTIFDSMLEKMVEKRVPKMDLTLYVTPTVNTILKNAKGITRQLAVGSQRAIVERAIASLDEVDIVEVPSDLMKTVYDFTDGFAAAKTAQQINMFLVQPQCIITPVSYEAAALDEPSAKTNLKYYYYEESHEDVFILPNKYDGVAFNVTAATP